MADDNDLVMESTTDSPEQIADGLGVELAPETTLETSDAATADEPVIEAGATDVPAEGDESDQPGEVTPEVARVAAPKRAPRPQRKTADAAAAAARRQADADKRVLEEENAALRRRLEQLSTGLVTADATATRPVQAVDAAPVVVAPEDISDEHPALATVQAQIAKLGVKPQQADFDDYDAFETARDEWIENRASLKARLNFVREDVARQESIALDAANRAARETAVQFESSVQSARQRYEDYDDVMATAREQDLRVPRDLGQALMESPVGADVLYYLCTNPAEVERITALSTTRALAEIGKLEGRIQARLGGRPGPRGIVPAPTARPGARITRAPEPQRTVLGDMPSTAVKRDLNDPSLSQSEYNRLRDQMDRESGRRAN